MKINRSTMKKIGLGSIFLIAFAIIGCVRESDTSRMEEAVTSEVSQLYTCGMHPNVIQEGPGNCPICGMELTPIGQPSATASAIAEPSTGERDILYWRAPMDPTYISPNPGKSPMGMDLIPVYEGEEAFGATVMINPVVQQNMGVRTATAERRDLHQTIRTIGRIDYNEAKVAHINTKFTGWIEKTLVNTTGQRVEMGESLLEIYSPQLVTAQEEYLDAYRNLQTLDPGISASAITNLESLIASTQRRLEYFDISKDQIDRLTQTGEVRKTLTLTTPFEGIVTIKHALDGMQVNSGMNLYTIADLSEIWVYADIYENEVPWLEIGQEATMTLSYDPGKVYTGQVQYIYPYLEERTRTIKARLSFPNPDLELKPGMYANVEIQTSPVKNIIAVPAEAVLFSGERNLVIVALGEGRFAPRNVTIGVEDGDGYYQILDGLTESEMIVTSGQFLLDSESRLQENIAKMLQSSSVDQNSQLMIEQEDSHENHQHQEEEMNMDTVQEPVQHIHQGMHEMESGSMGDESIPFGTVVDGNITYYTCPMESHSFVKMSEPGQCPECGMTLVAKTEPFDPAKEFYTCPMPEHSHVVMDEPGECPVCQMELVPLQSQ